MRTPILSVSLLLAAGLAAQSPLSTGLTPNNQGNNGGGLYFDLQVNTTVSITQIDHWVGTNGTTAGNLALDFYICLPTYVNNLSSPSRWVNLGQATATGYVPNSGAYQLQTFIFATPVVLGAGNYGIALKSQNAPPTGTVAWNHGYTNGTGCSSSTVPGSCTNSLHTNTELTLRAGAAQNGFLGGGIFTPRCFAGNIHYTLGGNPSLVAAFGPYGEGCYAYNTSYAELFPNPSTSLDISDQTHTFTYAGNAYLVTGTATNTFANPGPGAIALPMSAATDTASVAQALGGSLPFPILYPRGGGVGLADDLEVCASGFITPVDVAGNGTSAAAPGANAGDDSPDLSEFFGTGVERWAPMWQDMSPSSNILVEVIGPQLVITWQSVLVTGLTGTNTFQFVIDSSGNVEYRYGTTSGNGGGGWPLIIGLTQGTNALVNEIDVSVDVLAGFMTHVFDNTPLAMTLDSRPLLGTSPNFEIDGYHAATTALGVVAVSFTKHDPGIPLAAFRMPGCFQYTDPVAIRSFVTGGAASVTMPFIPGGIPNIASVNGVEFLAQALTITGDCGNAPCNSIGVIASNGLSVLLGSL